MMDATATPWHVTSRDGTAIGVSTSGDGPPLVLVHGVLCDHSRWRPLVPHLAPALTVHAIDRRGRAASGDHPEYRIEREFEDVAAVVDEVAARSGQPVHLYGHSYGGNCVLGAATLTDNVAKLGVYEPILDAEAVAPAPSYVERLEQLVAAGDYDAVVATMYREGAGMSEDEITAYRASPGWPARVATAPTGPRELRAEIRASLREDRVASIEVPVLLGVGGDSPAETKRSTEAFATRLADARVVEIAGQQHIADAIAPELVATALLDFLGVSVPTGGTT